MLEKNKLRLWVCVVQWFPWEILNPNFHATYFWREKNTGFALYYTYL